MYCTLKSELNKRSFAMILLHLFSNIPPRVDKRGLFADPPSPLLVHIDVDCPLTEAKFEVWTIIYWFLSFFRLLVVYQIQVVKKKVGVRQILKWVVPKIRRVPLTRISTKSQKVHIASQNRKSQVKKLEIDNKDNLITYLYTSFARNLLIALHEFRKAFSNTV